MQKRYEERPDNTNVFRNKDKEAASHPDFTGTVTLSKEVLRDLVDKLKAGKAPTLRVAMWEKEGQKAGTYYSMSVSVPKPKQASKPAVDDDDEIPF